MKKIKYSKEVKVALIFNLIFILIGLVLIPLLSLSVLLKNIILGTLTALDAGLFLMIILKPEKLDKASGTLLLISFMAVATVIFKWAGGLI
ncbi:MAG: hypothetical protein RR061_09700 [Muribaculaceae bacterium]